ncbi:hypothetical protein [Deinococcus arcticus]|uniref:Uncharacterized protein n=1 Tax=Deinococcus arcticus TaxID=2136176 RepID=A0A2T3WAK2_9DEIO|nr:hypothetical protein [Deinococcus arcticus]PTA68929.1 hypothetical protein C8263_03750 [Deinococcus arcticus]
MPAVFRAAIASALPSADGVRARLLDLPGVAVQALAEYFSAHLPEVDVLVALPGAEALAAATASLRGTSLAPFDPVRGLHTRPEMRGVRGQPVAALLTPELIDGHLELQALLHAEHLGWEVRAVAAAVERTTGPGRARLEFQGVPLLVPVLLADTPGGLVFERRIPQPE